MFESRDTNSAEGGPEGGERLFRVAGVVAEAAARFAGPVRLSTPIARLRKVAMTCGAVPVRTWGGVL